MSHLEALAQESQQPLVSVSGKISQAESDQLDELLAKHKMKRPRFAAAAIRDAMQQLAELPVLEQADGQADQGDGNAELTAGR